jgi:hypothetical protein
MVLRRLFVSEERKRLKRRVFEEDALRARCLPSTESFVVGNEMALAATPGRCGRGVGGPAQLPSAGPQNEILKH